MKNELTTGAWQDDISCPINIILGSTSDAPLFPPHKAEQFFTKSSAAKYVWHNIRGGGTVRIRGSCHKICNFFAPNIIFRVGSCICCSQYANNFIMQTGIPVCEYFSDPRPYAYGDPRMHTAIPVCIWYKTWFPIWKQFYFVWGPPYANVPAICKHTRVYAKNHLEYC